MRDDAAKPVASAPGSDPGAGRVAGRMALLLDARRAKRGGAMALERRRRARTRRTIASSTGSCPSGSTSPRGCRSPTSSG